jgi:tRNA-2-methylthio-N6-dimethylallyladenosine synthase
MILSAAEDQNDHYITKVIMLNNSCGRTMRYSYKTFGCQMNENDSEKICGIMEKMGYIHDSDFEKADLIFFNTCCVRESAEDKIYGWIGGLKELKAKNNGLVLCLAGCMMEQEQSVEKVRRKYGFIDIILGTDDMLMLPEKLYHIRTGDSKTSSVPEIFHGYTEIPYISRSDSSRAYVTIMKGCNNFCSYCVVPFVRGREASRKPEAIIDEIKGLADKGYAEVTLLGQNVNSYGNDLGDRDLFSDLLVMISDIKGIEWIKFMTSHPKDLSDRLIRTVRDIDKVCGHIHLPLQSGSTKILSEMNRNYTKEHFLGLVEKIRSEIDEISITSDVMVGFPGETEVDFADTLDVVQRSMFDNSYMFIYSKRNGTAAAARTDLIDRRIVKERFDRLMGLQNSISLQQNKKMSGRKYRLLVTGRSKNDNSMFTGITESNKLVHFKGTDDIKGKFVFVRINDVRSFSLKGELQYE